MESGIVDLGEGQLKSRHHRLEASAILALTCFLAVGSAKAESAVEEQRPIVAFEPKAVVPVPTLPRVPLPLISTAQTVDLDQGRATQTPSTSQHQDWWIWAGIAGVAIAVTAIVIFSAPSNDSPDTTLGNMKAFQ